MTMLQSCPFCGNPPELHRALKSKTRNGDIYVMIPNTEAKSKWEWNTYSIRCRHCNFAKPVCAYSEEEAATSWNTRVDVCGIHETFLGREIDQDGELK